MDPWILFFSGTYTARLPHAKDRILAVAKPLIFLAKISYSLYLYHSLIFELTFRHWPSHLTASMNPLPRALLQFFVEAILSIVVAALSRYTLEEYFLRLKPSHPRTPTASQRHGPNRVNWKFYGKDQDQACQHSPHTPMK